MRALILSQLTYFTKTLSAKSLLPVESEITENHPVEVNSVGDLRPIFVSTSLVTNFHSVAGFFQVSEEQTDGCLVSPLCSSN